MHSLCYRPVKELGTIKIQKQPQLATLPVGICFAKSHRFWQKARFAHLSPPALDPAAFVVSECAFGAGC